MTQRPINLLALIGDTFNEDELHNLCFELGIDFEELPAIYGKSGKARELILLCQRHGRISELVSACQELRPHINWPDPSQLGVDPLEDARPFQPFEPKTILIPNGVFLMGSTSADQIPVEEQPQHEVDLLEYRIGATPITYSQYAAFLKQAKYGPPRGWLGPQPPPGREDHPVVYVSWYDALAYCEWLREQTKRPYRLPTEAEWEKAARGVDGRLYPWGNEWADDLCNHRSNGTTTVFTFSEGASPYGCLDMVGNVREWTSTLWGDDYREPEFNYPYRNDDGREHTAAPDSVYRIVRSSAYDDRHGRFRCAARAWYAPGNKDNRRGFRIVIGRV